MKSKWCGKSNEIKIFNKGKIYIKKMRKMIEKETERERQRNRYRKRKIYIFIQIKRERQLGCGLQTYFVTLWNTLQLNLE